jgi:hypothetical protein
MVLAVSCANSHCLDLPHASQWWSVLHNVSLTESDLDLYKYNKIGSWECTHLDMNLVSQHSCPEDEHPCPPLILSAYCQWLFKCCAPLIYFFCIQYLEIKLYLLNFVKINIKHNFLVTVLPHSRHFVFCNVVTVLPHSRHFVLCNVQHTSSNQAPCGFVTSQMCSWLFEQYTVVFDSRILVFYCQYVHIRMSHFKATHFIPPRQMLTFATGHHKVVLRQDKTQHLDSRHQHMQKDQLHVRVTPHVLYLCMVWKSTLVLCAVHTIATRHTGGHTAYCNRQCSVWHHSDSLH